MTSILYQTKKFDAVEADSKTLDDKTLFLLAQCGRNWAVMLSGQGNYLDARGIHRQVSVISSNLVSKSRVTMEQYQSSDNGKGTSSRISFTTLLLLHADLYSLLGTIDMEQNLGLLAVSRMEEALKSREEALKTQTHYNAKYIQQQKEHIDLAVQTFLLRTSLRKSPNEH